MKARDATRQAQALRVAEAGVSRERPGDGGQLVADERGASACSYVGGVHCEKSGLQPARRFVAFATAGVEPERFGIGPVPAIARRWRSPASPSTRWIWWS